MTAANEAKAILQRLGVDAAAWNGHLPTRSPIDGSTAGSIVETADVDGAVARSVQAFHAWKRVPGPASRRTGPAAGRGTARVKDDLARLVTLEAGKIVSEASARSRR
jgi:aldehyde dehydrogenase (NAD+)